MCGIAGLIGRVDEHNRAALRRMSGALVHRGPDGEGFWETISDTDDWGVMLAHRRLSILDLSDAAAQPMVDPTTGNVIVLNGEIYNYIELRQELTSAGHNFQSTGDTAVMLRALSVTGHGAIATLRGMFAFALWDTRDRSLLIARDALGIKPLYIAQNADLSFKPGLLTKWGWNADRTKVEMEVREGAVWHNGDPVTAEDVVWSVDKVHLLHSLGSQGNGVRRRLLGLFHVAMHHADPRVPHEKQNARDAIAGQGATHFP